MPELPEVEVIRRGLEPHLAGRRIVEVRFGGHRLRKPVRIKALRQWLCNARIETVGRRAKYLLITMDNRACLVIHLGMTGRLGLFPFADHLLRHDHLGWKLDNGLEMRFNDTRRFGAVEIFPPDDPALPLFLASLGPEPFAPEFSAAHLARLASGSRRPVKNLLLDGRVVAGIGNIYASEILFDAAIRPERPAGEITAPEWRRVVEATRLILQRAIAAGGTTIRDFVDSSGRPGYFKLQLAVYGRGGQPCPRCDRAIEKIVQAGRATYFCPGCQG